MASPSLLRRLGLPEDLPLSELASVPWTAPADTRSLAALVAEGQGDFARFAAIPWSDELAPGLGFSRSIARPELVLVEGSALARSEPRGDGARLGSNSVLFVGSEGSALAIGPHVLAVEHGRLLLCALPVAEVEAQEQGLSVRAALEGLALLGPWESPRERALAARFADCAVEPWLLADAVELAERAGAHSPFAAVGLVLRLHEPAPESPSDALASALSGALPVASLAPRAARWWDENQGSHGAVLADALAECDAAREALLALPEHAEGDHPALRSIARRWLRRRDDLESARHALAAVRQSATLDRALDALDDAASAELTLFSALGPFDADPRFSAVSWQQPHLWWSGLFA